MARKKKRANQDHSRPVVLQLLFAVAALAITWQVSLVAWALAFLLVSWLLSRMMVNAWWSARSRQYGRDLEARSLSDLSRLSRLFRMPIQLNVPVPGLGDADAVLGSRGVVVEVKSYRRWSLDDPRCLDAISQVERLMARLGSSRGLIWLPNAELSTLERLGFQPGLPKGVRVIGGPAWRPLVKAAF